MIRKLAVVGAIITGVVVLVAGPAFAHVEIERDGQVGADGIVNTTLHVPNEETNAGTVKVELVFPANPVAQDRDGRRGERLDRDGAEERQPAR